MEEIIVIIQQNVHYAPWIIFGLLLLAGLNIPVSEDAMLFISAMIAAQSPDQLPSLFIAVYLGAFFSDIICYWLGRKVGPKLWNIKFFAKSFPKEKIQQISSFYEKYGIATLIVGRFIPFGVRNGLFLTAGLGKMNFIKFALSDLLACTISSICFFSLYYKFGPTMVDYVKKGNIIFFSIIAISVLIFYFAKKKKTTVQ